MTLVKITPTRAVAHIRMNAGAMIFATRLEGRRLWLMAGGLSFEPTGANLRALRVEYPDLTIDDQRPASPSQEAVDGLGTSSDPSVVPAYRTKPYAHQRRAIEACDDRIVFALFMGTGTGKTWVAINHAARLRARGRISAVLIVAPSGVHRQWIEEQTPLHMPAAIGWVGHVWEKRAIPPALHDPDRLAILAVNIDALRTPKGFGAVGGFIRAHGGRVLMAIDESQSIKTHNTARTIACYDLGRACSHRMIMSGTPIAKDLTDEWSQFKFLDPSILGYKYISSFRAEFCLMGGFEGRAVVGHKNLDRFTDLTRDHIFRVTKEEELDLPPKIYERFVFHMHPAQRALYDNLKREFLARLEGGEVVSVPNAATLLGRLQQITCGHTMTDVGDLVDLPNARMEALRDVLQKYPDQRVIIWARYRYDIKAIVEMLGEKNCVTYYGDTSDKDRLAAKEKFLNPHSEIKYFVANPQSGGSGLNLQGICTTAIYYSNSYNAIDRWQSEDRIHRIGTKSPVNYIDLICRGSPDLKILNNLKKKKSLSDLVLGDFRGLLEAPDEADHEQMGDEEMERAVRAESEWRP